MYQNVRKRLLSVILSLAMIASLLPLAAFAAEDCNHTPPAQADSTTQIQSGARPADSKDISYQYFTKDGKTTTLGASGDNAALVGIAKTIAPTKEENVFDVTLDVKTTHEIKEIQTSEDAATVLVMDVSGSMDFCVTCGNGKDDKTGPIWDREYTCKERDPFVSRLDAAKTAAKAFLDTYVKSARSADGKPVAKRYVSLVTFSEPAWPTLKWIDIAEGYNFETNTGPNYSTAVEAINGLRAKTGTNMEAGLMIARNMLRTDLDTTSGGYKALADKKITNANVILLSDGAPNWKVIGNRVAVATIDDEPGWLGEDIIEECSTKRAERWAKVQANDIKSSSFSADSKTYSKQPATLYTIALGNTGESETNHTFLSDSIASSKSTALAASSGSALELAFKQIAKQIELSANPWTVTDPMGNNIVWDAEANKNLKNVTFTPATATEPAKFLWDLQAATKDGSFSVVDKTWRSYQLTYKISLNTQAADFTPATALATNGETTLYYVVEDAGNKVHQSTVKFTVPTVKGYKADFSFSKKGQDESLLNGFEFTLTDPVTNWTTSAKSTNGTVSFTGIPSGHTYKLAEKSTVPSEYAGKYETSGKTYDVVVSYGEVFILDGNNLVAHYNNSNCKNNSNFTFYNPLKSIEIPITKVINQQSADSTFKFGLFIGNSTTAATTMDIKVPANTDRVTQNLTLSGDTLTAALKASKLTIAEVDGDGKNIAGTEGSNDGKGYWTYAPAQEFTVNKEGQIVQGDGFVSGLTFQNDYTKTYKVTVEYYLDNVKYDAFTETVTGLEKDDAYAVAEKIKKVPAQYETFADGKLGLFDSGDTTFTEPVKTLDAAQKLVRDNEAKMGDSDITIKFVYKDLGVTNSLAIPVTKQLTIHAEEKNQPSNLTFEFALQDKNGHAIDGATASISFDAGTTTGTKSAEITLNNWTDYVGQTLELVETNATGWVSSHATAKEYVTINENGTLTYLGENGTKPTVTNSFTQEAKEATVTATKTFSFDETGAATYKENYWLGDGSKKSETLTCEHASVCPGADTCTETVTTTTEIVVPHPEDCSICAETPDECAKEATTTTESKSECKHLHNADCYDYTYTFEFGLFKGDASTPIQTTSITVSKSDFLKIINGEQPKFDGSISFTIAAEDIAADTYKIKETASPYLGWTALPEPLVYSIDAFGNLTKEPESKIMNNPFLGENAPTMPKLTITKELLDSRKNDAAYVGNWPETFKVGVYTDADTTQKLTEVILSGGKQSETIKLPTYLSATTATTLYVKEIAGSLDGMTYDDTTYTITIPAAFGEDELAINDRTKSVTVTNKYFEPITPVFTIEKTINQNVTLSGDKFKFKYVANTEGKDIYTGTATVTVPNGTTAEQTDVKLSAITDVDFTNFTGTITVTEENPNPNGNAEGWVLANKAPIVLTYANGVLISDGVNEIPASVASFYNCYYTANVNLSKIWNDSGYVLTGSRAHFTLTISNSNSTDALTNIVLTDTAFASSALGISDLKIDSILVGAPGDEGRANQKTTYSIADGAINFGELKLPVGHEIVVSYSFQVDTKPAGGTYKNEATVTAKGVELGTTVTDEAESTADIKDFMSDFGINYSVDKKVALYDATIGDNYGGYTYISTAKENAPVLEGNRGSVVYQITLTASAKDAASVEKGPKTVDFYIDDILTSGKNTLSLNKYLWAANTGKITERDGKYVVTLPLNYGDEAQTLVLYYKALLSNWEGQPITHINTVKMTPVAGGNTESSSVYVTNNKYNPNLVASKQVAIYKEGTALDAHSYSSHVSFLDTAKSKVVFKVSIKNTGEDVIYLTSIQDYFSFGNVNVTSVLDANGNPVSLTSYKNTMLCPGGFEGTEPLSPDEIVFYYISEPMTTKGDYTNKATFEWTNFLYGEEGTTDPDNFAVEKVELTATVTVTSETGTNPGGPTGPTDTGHQPPPRTDTNTPPVVIPDVQPPLGDFEVPDVQPPLDAFVPETDDLIVLDEEVPLGNLPQTSSSTTAGIMTALMASLGLLGLGLVKRKEDEI